MKLHLSTQNILEDSIFLCFLESHGLIFSIYHLIFQILPRLVRDLQYEIENLSYFLFFNLIHFIHLSLLIIKISTMLIFEKHFQKLNLDLAVFSQSSASINLATYQV